MLAPKFLVVVLLVATQLQKINPLDLLGAISTTPRTEILFPDSLKEVMERMSYPFDPNFLHQNQTIENYAKPTQRNVRFFLYCNRRQTQIIYTLGVL